MKQALNDLFFEYCKGKLKRIDFEGLIYNYLIYNQEKTCLNHWDRNEYEDFISWFYPRLKLSIDSYNETGSSFEAFFAKFIFISAKEYHVKTTVNYVTEYCAWSARVPDMYTHEESPSYNIKENDAFLKLITDNGKKNTRRILALILKCYYYVSDDFAEKIAPLLRMETDELKYMLEKIRKIRQIKDDNIYYMKERIYRQFYRCIIYEKRLLLIKDNVTAYNNLNKRLQKARFTLERMRERINFFRTAATNRQIAEVLGTTKGTVDASLVRLKLKWEKLSQKADLN
ncbi:MAG: hypothetical protein FWD47_10090 [Treponema sp.]|nr:hypothetical protein [Treponema sp.]